MHPFIHEASLVKVFETILIILIIYYVFSFIIRSVFPLLMRKYINDFQNRFTEDNKRAQEEHLRKKEGEISIKYVDKDKNKTHNPDEGDYVDYEEIK